MAEGTSRARRSDRYSEPPERVHNAAQQMQAQTAYGSPLHPPAGNPGPGMPADPQDAYYQQQLYYQQQAMQQQAQQEFLRQ